MKNLIFLFFPLVLQAQVAKTIVVEHFTNSKCSVCAEQNPSFFQNLANQPNVKHIAYHPSSPYSTCIFSQHNPSENDARTNFYGVYGSTPRLAIQGSAISNSPNPFPNPNLYDSYQGQTSPFSLTVYQGKDADSIRVQIVLKTVANHSFSDLRLYAAVAEDTIFYTSPNGETLHHDVFRKTFFGPNGILISPPAMIGDSIIFKGSLAKHAAWNFNRIFGYAMIQNSTTRAMVQTDVSNPSANVLTANSEVQSFSEVFLYPNPSTMTSPPRP